MNQSSAKNTVQVEEDALLAAEKSFQAETETMQNDVRTLAVEKGKERAPILKLMRGPRSPKLLELERSWLCFGKRAKM